MRLYGADAERYTEEHIQANGLHEKLALGDQPFKFDIQYTADGRFAIPPDGVPRALRLLVLTISGTLRRVGSSYEHYRYEGHSCRVATPDIGDGEIGRVIMTQPGGPGSTAVYADLQLPPGKNHQEQGQEQGEEQGEGEEAKAIEIARHLLKTSRSATTAAPWRSISASTKLFVYREYGRHLELGIRPPFRFIAAGASSRRPTGCLKWPIRRREP